MRFIKDPIHKNILCSDLEFKIFALPIFNRLHYIMQNSMVYFVYPMNKTSRFAHSIGVMHIASKIFENSLINSEQQIYKEYIEYLANNISNDLNDIIGSLTEIDFAAGEKNKCPQNIDGKCITTGIYELLGKEFVNSISIKNNIVIITLQALRLFALFHDIGHLPFSHIGEFALEEFLEKYKDKDKSGILNYLFERESKAIHEDIGKKLIDLIFLYIEEEFKQNKEIEKYVVFRLIKATLDKIINETYKELYEIISSDIDADRLDYVFRDSFASGIPASYDIDRIIKTFYLTKDKAVFNVNGEPVERDIFKILPSLRSINDINKFFWDRAYLYKMVINHHKVKKFDFMLQLSIEKILEEEFNRLNFTIPCDTSKISIEELMDMICIIYELFTLKNSSREKIKGIFFKFSQLTDFWLLNLIKKRMIESLISEDDSSYKLFSEIISGSKNIVPLYKRTYEYFSEFSSDDRRYILNNKIRVIDNNIFIVKVKTPSHPEKVEIFDNSTKRVLKGEEHLKNIISLKDDDKHSLYIFYDIESYPRKEEVVERVKEFLNNTE